MCRAHIFLVAPLLIGLYAAGCAADARAAPERELRVCADPNNLPFSNAAEEGLENEIARVVARELDADLSYTWWPQRRGFVRNTLNADLCDVVLGMPSSMELALVTRPYYRSTYVFLTRRDRGIDIRGLDDPELHDLRIGIHLIGDDYSNSPAAAAFARRGLGANLVGYSIYGNYEEANPPARLVEAVVKGEVDVAVVWGPLAGYFAREQGAELAMTAVTPQVDLPFTPFVYDISFAVERGDTVLRDELDAVIERRRAEIAAILEQYGVPIVTRD